MRSITLFLLGGLCFVCNGQVSQTSGVLSLYQQQVGITNDPIFIGELDPLIVRSRTTHPFFNSRGWVETDLEFDNSSYQKIPALYDLTRDILILRYPDASKIFGIIPNMPLVKSFKINDSYFRTSSFSSDLGFYEVLIEGDNFQFLVKRSKEEKVDKAEVVFIEKNTYFLEYENKLIPLNSKKDLAVLGDIKALNAKVRATNKTLKYSKFKEERLINYMKALDDEMEKG